MERNVFQLLGRHLLHLPRLLLQVRNLRRSSVGVKPFEQSRQVSIPSGAIRALPSGRRCIGVVRVAGDVVRLFDVELHPPSRQLQGVPAALLGPAHHIHHVASFSVRLERAAGPSQALGRPPGGGAA